MASVDVKKIRLNSGTTYNIKDSRIPALTNDTATFLRSDGTWSDPTANLPETTDVVDNGTYMTIQPTGSSSGVVLQSKTGITPLTTSQTIRPDSGYGGLSSVQINAMPSGAVSAPTSISGSSATVSTGTNTLTLTKTISVTPNVSTAGYISAGTATNSSVSLTASITTKAAATITPTTSNQSIAAGTYLTGAQTIKGDSNLVAGNIKSGVTIFGVSGSYSGSGSSPSLQAKTGITPSTSSQTITPDSGYDGLSSVQINAMPSGTTTSPTSISGTSATVSTGTNTITLTKTISVTPRVTTAGYVSAGTAGNSSVSLTASVTTKAAATITPGTSNQTIAAGTYITGTQTISGDADLTAANIKKGVQIFGVTGTYTSDANATAANIASGKTAYVNGSKITGTLTFQTYYTGSSAPASSLGADGDIYLQS